jgi:hypothetical protein
MTDDKRPMTNAQHGVVPVPATNTFGAVFVLNRESLGPFRRTPQMEEFAQKISARTKYLSK